MTTPVAPASLQVTRLTDIRLTILVDNTSTIDGLRAEHGFSCLVESDGHRVLFDTGAKDALHDNSNRLGVDLRRQAGRDAIA